MNLLKVLLLLVFFSFATGMAKRRPEGTTNYAQCSSGTSFPIDFAYVDGTSSSPESRCGRIYDAYFASCGGNVANGSSRLEAFLNDVIFGPWCSLNTVSQTLRMAYLYCTQHAIGIEITRQATLNACSCAEGGKCTEEDEPDPIPDSTETVTEIIDTIHTVEAVQFGGMATATQLSESPEHGDATSTQPKTSAATEGSTTKDSKGKIALSKARGAWDDRTKGSKAKAGSSTDSANAGLSGSKSDVAKTGLESGSSVGGGKSGSGSAYESAANGKGGNGSGSDGGDYQSASGGGSGSRSGSEQVEGVSGPEEGNGADSYLEAAGTMSLFERVRPHYGQWGNQLEMDRAKAEFRSLTK